MRATNFWDEAAENDAKFFITNQKMNESQFFASGILSVEQNLRELGFDLPSTKFDCIIEIGCGIGRESFTLIDYCKTLYAIDISTKMIKLAESYKISYSRPKSDIRFRSCNGIDLKGFKDNFFDFAYSYIALQHCGSLATVFTNLIEINRVLHKGGIAAILLRTNEDKTSDYNEIFKEIDTPAVSKEELQEWSVRMKLKKFQILYHRDKTCNWLKWQK